MARTTHLWNEFPWPQRRLSHLSSTVYGKKSTLTKSVSTVYYASTKLDHNRDFIHLLIHRFIFIHLLICSQTLRDHRTYLSCLEKKKKKKKKKKKQQRNLN